MDITGKSTVRLIQIYLIFLFCLGTYCVLIWDKKWIGSNFFFLELVDFQRFFFFPELLVAHQSPLSHGIFQVGILEWVAISSSRGSSQPRHWTCISRVSCFAGGFFTRWEFRIVSISCSVVSDSLLSDGL